MNIKTYVKRKKERKKARAENVDSMAPARARLRAERLRVFIQRKTEERHQQTDLHVVFHFHEDEEVSQGVL